MLASILSIMQDECALVKGRLLVVGVSGGPDSLCLLDILHKLGYRLLVAHVNHGLRLEAAADQRLVELAADQRRLPIACITVDVRGYADSASLTVEEAARHLRYRFLFEQAELNNAQAVVVGHNADDQVETVLMHLLRGSGLNGLRGMPVRSLPNAWSQTIPLVRPLLRTWREEIDSYCAENGLQPAQDQTNLLPLYTRNRIRLELIPQLETIQPGVRSSLLRLARLVSAEDDLLQETAQTAWNHCLVQESPQFIALDLQATQHQPLAIQRRLLRRAAAELRPGLDDVGFEDIERGLQFIRQPTQTGQMDWLAGIRLSVEAGKLWLSCWEADLPLAGWPQLSPAQVLQLSVPGAIQLAGGWLLRATPVALDADGQQQILLNRDPYQTWLDAGRLDLPLVLRGRQTGDVFEPLGMHGQRVNLKDWMIKQKLPQRARSGWPLLCSGDQIAWIPGFQLAHWARITPATRRIVYLHLSMNDD